MSLENNSANNFKDFLEAIKPYLNYQFYDLSGQGVEANNFSTDEKVIGTWIDGKPLYQKVIESTLPEATVDGDYPVAKIVSINTPIDSLVYSYACFCNTSTGNYTPMNVITDSNENRIVRYSVASNSASSNKNSITLANSFPYWNNLPVYVTLRYTKTTDTAVASGEKIVGQWIDGKPVFEKVITNISLDPIPSGSSISQTNVCSLNGINIIRDEVYGDNGIERFVLPYSDMTASKIIKSRELRAEVMQYVIMHNNSQFDRSGDYRFTAILQYTKNA